ncbi:unnamed protein product [Meganyctiphanes norvegica]|uniref:Uncharacterized protein n=1 Tax=Meganyctiphanes norvegica TaxID=48144 RepID=A0AAV2Q3E4_MEGNR
MEFTLQGDSNINRQSSFVTGSNLASQPGGNLQGAESCSVRTENPLDALLDELQTFAKPPAENDATNATVDITTIITPASPAPTSVVPTNILSNTTPIAVSPLCQNSTTKAVTPLCLTLPSGVRRLPSYPSSDSQPSPVKTPSNLYPGFLKNCQDTSVVENKKANNTPSTLYSSETSSSSLNDKNETTGVKKFSNKNYKKLGIDTKSINHNSDVSNIRNEIQVDNKSEKTNCSSKLACEDSVLSPKEPIFKTPKVYVDSSKDSVSNRNSKCLPTPPCPPARSSSKTSTILPISACSAPAIGKGITPGGMVTSVVNGVLRNSEGRELYGPVLRQRPPLGRASFSEDSSFSSASTNSSTGSSRAGQLSSNSSSTESVNSQEGASSKSQQNEQNVDSKQRQVEPKPRQDVLEQRHIELLRRQKQLQEQYQRLQNIQRSGGRLAPANVDLKKTGSESNLTAQLGLSLHPSSLGSQSTTVSTYKPDQPPTHTSTLPKNYSSTTTNDKCKPTIVDKENIAMQEKKICDDRKRETDII